MSRLPQSSPLPVSGVTQTPPSTPSQYHFPPAPYTLGPVWPPTEPSSGSGSPFPSDSSPSFLVGAARSDPYPHYAISQATPVMPCSPFSGTVRDRRHAVLDLDFSTDSEDYESETDSETSPDDEEAAHLSNGELADMLPRKTVPVPPQQKRGIAAGVKRKHKDPAKRPRKKKGAAAPLTGAQMFQYAVDQGWESAAPAASGGQSSSAHHRRHGKEKKPSQSRKESPIFCFYEQVDSNTDTNRAVEGDRHYRCFHAHPDSGVHKTLTMTRLMKHSKTALHTHLQKIAPQMFTLFQILKNRPTPPTPVELQIARGATHLIPMLGYSLEEAARDLPSTVHGAMNTEPWNQARFEELLARWMIASDQPFTEVEDFHFRELLQHGRAERIHIPSADTMKRRIEELGGKILEETRDRVKMVESMVSLALDVWTSSNGHAFLAIVMSYVTDDWELEELLIDFQELIGQHNGENLAEAVWTTMQFYGLVGRVLAIMADNASNNDTMMDELAKKCAAAGIPFSAKEARMRCLPHTIHLAAWELLKALGTLPKDASWATQAPSSNGNYHEDVISPISDEQDRQQAACQDESVTSEDSAARDMSEPEVTKQALGAIGRLRAVIKAVRSSPQRRRAWLDLVEEKLIRLEAALDEIALMLILDVKTRWTSTHQMLARALKYDKLINYFIVTTKELEKYVLSTDDWLAIKLVCRWLGFFRAATVQMSATKNFTLSTCHAIFLSLQDKLRSAIADLPMDAPAELRKGLRAAHTKLSDYYYTVDQSPYYIWACLLDPRIGFQGMITDAGSDREYLAQIKEARRTLALRFKSDYAATGPSARDDFGTAPASDGLGDDYDFLARYEVKNAESQDELHDYFALPRIPWKTADPIAWWKTVGSIQFPNLARFARDIFSIPGCAVAVERIFSGGRDTISLRRSSLKPTTIRNLMLAKNHLAAERARLIQQAAALR